jgi:hypothetical protein
LLISQVFYISSLYISYVLSFVGPNAWTSRNIFFLSPFWLFIDQSIVWGLRESLLYEGIVDYGILRPTFTTSFKVKKTKDQKGQTLGHGCAKPTKREKRLWNNSHGRANASHGHGSSSGRKMAILALYFLILFATYVH